MTRLILIQILVLILLILVPPLILIRILLSGATGGADCVQGGGEREVPLVYDDRDRVSVLRRHRHTCGGESTVAFQKWRPPVAGCRGGEQAW
jgi:hypothetical protein